MEAPTNTVSANNDTSSDQTSPAEPDGTSNVPLPKPPPPPPPPSSASHGSPPETVSYYDYATADWPIGAPFPPGFIRAQSNEPEPPVPLLPAEVTVVRNAEDLSEVRCLVILEMHMLIVLTVSVAAMSRTLRNHLL